MRPVCSSSSSRSQPSRVTHHQDRQLNRIQRGLGDGTLTQDEASGLMAKQARIAEAKSSAMADGSIDAAEHKQLRQLRRSASRDIFEQRHNASEAPVAPEQRAPNIDSHQTRQRNRIQKGLSDGTLTQDEATDLMAKQARIAEAKSSAMADGTMDEAEYNQLRQLQREASISIFNARHNSGIRG